MNDTVKNLLAAVGAGILMGGMWLGALSVMKTTEGRPLIETITVPEEPDPVAGEVWYDPTDCREQDPFQPVLRKRVKVLEIRGEWLQYEFNGGAEGRTPVVNSTKVVVFKSMYRRSK